MRIFSLLFLSCIVLNSCIDTGNKTNTADAPIELKLNFKPGVKYTYSNEINDTVSVPGTTKEMSIVTRVSNINTYSITYQGGNKKIDFSIDKVVIGTPLGEYNSEDTSSDLKILNGLKKQVHIHRHAIIDDKGEIKDIQKDVAEIDTSANEAFNSISMFSDDAIINSLKYLFGIFPGKLVIVGERWTNNIVFNIASVRTSIPIEFRLISADSGIAHIELNAQLKDLSDSTSRSQLHFMNMKGSVTGTLDMEISTGLITDYTQTTQLKGSMNISTHQMPATIITNIHVVGKEVK